MNRADELQPRLCSLPHLEKFTWQNATLSGRVTYPADHHKHDQIKMRDYVNR